MPQLLEVTYEDIQALDDRQLTDILRRLLHLDAVSAGIPGSCVDVSLKIDVGDGGEDGRIQWSGGPANTGWIPNRFTLFQCKATTMTPAACKKEFLKENSKDLKSQIEEVFEADGSYILFYGRTANGRQQRDRIREFRNAILEAGKPCADTASIFVYDANKIADWVNKYLPAVTTVLKYARRYVPLDLETWSSWSRHKENEYTFVCDEYLSAHIQTLRLHFSKVRQVARIVGRSGLGKTRLALEAFRPPDDPSDHVQQALSDQTVYLDVSSGAGDLLGMVASWRSAGFQGLIVVDNCPLELHQQLCSKVLPSDSNLNLLTMDYNPEKVNTAGYPFIELEPASTETVIKPMLKNAYPALRDEDINRIAVFAEGFPQMAVLLAEARLSDRQDIANLEDPVILQRLLWGRRQEDSEAHGVISACSLFEQVGFYEDVADQRRFIAENICGINPDRFYELAVPFIERGILDTRGRFVSVTPMPLAIRLAAGWWKGRSSERAMDLVTQSMPFGLAEAFHNQFSKLHFLPQARQLTSQMCSDSGPFGKAEVLNTEKGSRLFRSFAEVNPQATAEAMDRAFSSWSIEDLKGVGPGRRNLVWALEKLCFWEDTFSAAARSLMSFAAAENETWSNNATGQFLQLFQVFQSGTQASAKSRLGVIDEALDRPEEQYTVLGIKALGVALRTDHFSRMSGAEIQGSRAPQQEWRPQLWSEVFAYWRAGLNRLTPFVSQHGAIGDLARDQIASEIRGLVQQGLVDEVEAVIQGVADQEGLLWPHALEAIQHLIRYDGEHMPSGTKPRLLHWIKLLQPEGLPERLRLIVGMPPYDHEKAEDGHYVDVAAERAKDLAKELVGQDSDWMKHLEVVLHGEQRQGFVFGRALSEGLRDVDLFVSKVLDILSNLPTEGNVVVLGGFLLGLRNRDNQFVTKTLQLVADREDLRSYLVDLTRLSRPEPSDVDRAMHLVNAGFLPISSLRAFAYGSVLEHLDVHVVKGFCEALRGHSPQGAWIALDVLALYISHDPARHQTCQDAVITILMTPGLLAVSDSASSGDFWRWKETVISILKSPTLGRTLAEHLVDEILTVQMEGNYQVARPRAYASVIKELLTRHKDVVWPRIAERLLADDWRVRARLGPLLGGELISMDEQEEDGVLFNLPHRTLMEWCQSHPDTAPKVLARMVPLYARVDEKWMWHPLAKWLIDEFGRHQDVLSEITSNMGSFGWTGSAVPAILKQIEVVEQVRNHRRPEVRSWAGRRLTSLTAELERERLRDEEEGHGIYQR